jgi:hypothetical protein
MAQTSSMKFTSKSVTGIMRKRTLVPETLVGKKVVLTIRGNGTTVDVKDKEGNYVQSVVQAGTVFQKVIFNTESNSGIAMASARNKQILQEALAAERLGNADEASDLFQDFLNAVQLSFSVPTTSSLIGKLSDRIDISARVIKVTTENGSLLTIDPTSIAIKEPETLAPVDFDLSNYMGGDEEKEEEGETADELKDVLKA